uniref:hypothetical protein n=1 Tax=Planococcus sp. ZOYM TaxID=378212 RepID=UPI0015651985|nr:hypothetical protein [Planococcus sp. ZOYM]
MEHTNNKNLSMTIGITVFLSLLLMMQFKNLEIFYLATTLIFLEVIFFDKERKKNVWKFISGYALIILFSWILFNYF